jgi:hypothetical protein
LIPVGDRRGSSSGRRILGASGGIRLAHLLKIGRKKGEDIHPSCRFLFQNVANKSPNNAPFILISIQRWNQRKSRSPSSSPSPSGRKTSGNESREKKDVKGSEKQGVSKHSLKGEVQDGNGHTKTSESLIEVPEKEVKVQSVQPNQKVPDKLSELLLAIDKEVRAGVGKS